MGRLRRALRVRRPKVEDQASREVEDEVSFHIARRVEDLMAERGLSRSAAERCAFTEFGDLPGAVAGLERRARRTERRLRFGETLERIVRDFSLGVRRLKRQPAFAGVAAFTLALGIGATTAMFSVVEGVLLTPLSYPEADRLVALWHTGTGAGRERMSVSTGTFFTYLEENHTFEGVALWDNGQVTITGLGEPERVDHLIVSRQLLPLLRVRPTTGRFFNIEDDTPGSPLTAVLSHAYWQSRLGADPDVVGRTLTVNGGSAEIIGVLPPEFRFPGHSPSVLFPARLDRDRATVGRFQQQAIARLRPGVTVEEATADVERMLPLAVQKFSDWDPARLREIGLGGLVVPLKIEVIGEIATALWLVFGAVGILLVIALANVANLLLVRAESRTREAGIRATLGAGRATAIRELLLEGTALGVLGGALGVGLAFAGLELLQSIGRETLPRIDELGLDPRALAFSLAVTFASVLAFSLLPALKYTKPDLVNALKGGGRRSPTGGSGRARNGLAAAQVAMALVLLIGAGLMIRSFDALRSVDPGVRQPEQVLTFRLFIPNAEVEDDEAAVRMHGQILESIQSIPGVVSAAATNSVPMDGRTNNNSVYVAGFPVEEGDAAPSRRIKFISPGYFETLGRPLLAGRAFTWDDVTRRSTVTVVTEDFAREYWDDPRDAVGKNVQEGRGTSWKEIVGVVGVVHDDGLEQRSTPTLYWPLVVADFWGMDVFAWRSVVYTVRTSGGSPTALLPQIRRAVWSVNSSLPLANVRTLGAIVDRSTARVSFTLVLLSVAAAVALLLGMVGVYGVISYSVTARTREIGIRVALGAHRADITGMVVRQGLVLAGLGVGVGLLLAAGATRLMTAVLFEVTPVDPATYSLTAVSLIAIAALASWVPARRAAVIDPISTLRAD